MAVDGLGRGLATSMKAVRGPIYIPNPTMYPTRSLQDSVDNLCTGCFSSRALMQCALGVHLAAQEEGVEWCHQSFQES